MATHSSVLAWRIPGTGEPGGLPSMGSQQQQQKDSKRKINPKFPKADWNQEPEQNEQKGRY